MNMSRLSRQDYHGYTQQPQHRWSPSPPSNRLSTAVDPRLAPRMSATQQDLQPQSQTPQISSSQIAPSPVSIPSNAEVVQAINNMSAQVTNQLSVLGNQLASLVSQTTRLIEIQQMTLASGDSAGRAHNGTAPSGLTAQQLMRSDVSPATSSVDLSRNRANGAQAPTAFGSTVNAASNNTGRPDTRQSGQFYQNASSNNFRTTLDPSGSTLDRTFASTLRGASPTSTSAMSNTLSAAAGRTTQQQQQTAQQQQMQQQQQAQQQHHMQPQQHNMQQQTQQQQPDASQGTDDLLRSRLPSPVFPDDPLDMSTEVSTAGQQTPNNAGLKRLSTAGQGSTDSARKAANAEASLGDWKAWLNRTWHPPPGHQSRSIKYRTMQAARRAHRDQTKRSMATLGRLPLKEFLEIRPEQYLSVRKTGRKLYQEWLLQEVRLAKQPEDRVKAAVNRLENDHPELGDCEDHWKARQLLQQIIDNAIDEANLHRKKEARASNAHQEPNESTPRTMERSTSMLGLSASGSSSVLADVDRSMRGGDTSVSSMRKGAIANAANGPGGNKNTAKNANNRRKADQAELDDTPTRFRQPPSQRNSMLGISGNDGSAASSLQTQQGSFESSGLEAAHAGRGATLADYSGGYNNDSSTIASATVSDAMQASRQHATHGQHLQQQAQHTQHQQHSQHHPAHQQDQTHNAWASQTAAPGASLFGQSNYAPAATQQTLSHHQQQYGHHGHHHNSNYLSSDPQGLGAGGSGLLDDRSHQQSHLSPLVNGGSVRMHQPHQQQQQQQHHHQQQQQQQAQQGGFFDSRGYQ